MQCEVTKLHIGKPWINLKKNENLSNYSLGQSSIAKQLLTFTKTEQIDEGKCALLSCISIFVLSTAAFPALVSHAGWSKPTRIPRDFRPLTSCSRDSNEWRSSFSLYANPWECAGALNVTHSWFSSFAALNSFVNGARISSILLNMCTHICEHECTLMNKKLWESASSVACSFGVSFCLICIKYQLKCLGTGEQT